MDMDAIRAYFDNLRDIIDKVIDTQAEALHKGAGFSARQLLRGIISLPLGVVTQAFWHWNSITGPGAWPLSTL